MFMIRIGRLAQCAAVWGFVWAGSALSASAFPNPLAYDLPPRLTSLTELGLLADGKSDLTRVQRTDVLLRWLLEERRMPSPPTFGFGGGDITSGYVQQQFVRAPIGGGDPALTAALDDPYRVRIRENPAVRKAAEEALRKLGALPAEE